MSHNWIKNNLNGLHDITSENEKLFIEYCGKNHSNLPRMVTAINETTQELIMVNLSKF